MTDKKTINIAGNELTVDEELLSNAEKVVALMSQPGWPIFSHGIDVLRADIKERLLTDSSLPRELAQGYAQALSDVHRMMDQFVSIHEAMQNTTEKKRAWEMDDDEAVEAAATGGVGVGGGEL